MFVFVFLENGGTDCIRTLVVKRIRYEVIILHVNPYFVTGNGW